MVNVPRIVNNEEINELTNFKGVLLTVKLILTIKNVRVVYWNKTNKLVLNLSSLNLLSSKSSSDNVFLTSRRYS